MLKKTKGLAMLLVFLLSWVSVAVAEEYELYGNTYQTSQTEIEVNIPRKGDIAPLVDVLIRYPTITRVNMYQSRLSKDDMNYLFDTFPNVFFGWTIRFKNYNIKTDASAYSTAYGGTGRKRTEATLDVLRFCKNMKALDMGHNAISDFSFMKDFKDLRVLILVDNYVDRKLMSNLDFLYNFPNLEYLELHINHIKDTTPIASLQHLRDLNISYNEIEDFSPLLQCSSLKFACLSHNNITQEQIDMLVQGMPNTTFNFDATFPSGGGWRRIESFARVREMFKKNRYIPAEIEP